MSLDKLKKKKKAEHDHKGGLHLQIMVMREMRAKDDDNDASSEPDDGSRPEGNPHDSEPGRLDGDDSHEVDRSDDDPRSQRGPSIEAADSFDVIRRLSSTDAEMQVVVETTTLENAAG